MRRIQLRARSTSATKSSVLACRLRQSVHQVPRLGGCLTNGGCPLDLQCPRCGRDGPQHEVDVVEQNPHAVAVDTDLLDVDNAVELARQRGQDVFVATARDLVRALTAGRVRHLVPVFAAMRSPAADAGARCGPRTRRPGRHPVAFPLAYVSVPATKVWR